MAFAIFYVQQEGTGGKQIGIAVTAVVVAILLVFFSRLLGGAVMAAATFYVADKKNRSRIWALPALFLGPIILLVVVLLPKQPDTMLSLQ